MCWFTLSTATCWAEWASSFPTLMAGPNQSILHAAIAIKETFRARKKTKDQIARNGCRRRNARIILSSMLKVSQNLLVLTRAVDCRLCLGESVSRTPVRLTMERLWPIGVLNHFYRSDDKFGLDASKFAVQDQYLGEMRKSN
jgi:hypothetical protein